MALERLATTGAHEALQMPLLAQRADSAIHNWLVARTAARRMQGSVTLGAQRLAGNGPVLLCPEWLLARCAQPMIGVPFESDGVDTVADDGSVAVRADALVMLGLAQRAGQVADQLVDVGLTALHNVSLG